MAGPGTWGQATRLMRWEVGDESQWTGSGPGRLVVSLYLGWVVTAMTFGHHAVHSRWSWAGSTGLNSSTTVALGLALWAYWQLIRRTRTTLVPALREGEKGFFLPKPAPAYRWILGVIIGFGVSGITRHYGWPFELTLLFLLPWGIILGIESFNAYRETVQLGFELRDGALRAKLAPHFIFNTLNTLHAQIEQDPQGAQATTEKLAQLFREVLSVADRPTIPLKEELAFVEAYLGIEQVRLGGRLRVSIEVPEELESTEVPPLSLQVLVENAIKHGVAPLESGGEVRVGAERQDRSLYLWVEDPGSGFSSYRGTGTALETLRQRLNGAEGVEMGMVEGRHRVGFHWRQG